jgi:hypothetical protein
MMPTHQFTKLSYESSSGSADAKIVRLLCCFLVGSFKSCFLVVV